MKFIKWTILLIIIIFIGIIGTFLPSIIQSEYSRIFSIPLIDIEIHPEAKNDISKVEFIIVNKGNGPATNISLSIHSANKIVNITNEFSTTEIFLPAFNKTLNIGINQTVNSNSLELYIPKLIGIMNSLLDIVITIDLNNYDKHKKNYYVLAEYDQGIVEGRINNEIQPENIFKNLFYFLLYTSIAIFFIFYLVKYRNYKKNKIIINNVKTLRILLQDPDTNQSFLNEFKQFKIENVLEDAIINDTNFHNFYKKLEEREQKINTDKIKRYNLDALKLADELVFRDLLGKYD